MPVGCPVSRGSVVAGGLLEGLCGHPPGGHLAAGLAGDVAEPPGVPRGRDVPGAVGLLPVLPAGAAGRGPGGEPGCGGLRAAPGGADPAGVLRIHRGAGGAGLASGDGDGGDDPDHAPGYRHAPGAGAQPVSGDALDDERGLLVPRPGGAALCGVSAAGAPGAAPGDRRGGGPGPRGEPAVVFGAAVGEAAGLPWRDLRGALRVGPGAARGVHRGHGGGGVPGGGSPHAAVAAGPALAAVDPGLAPGAAHQLVQLPLRSTGECDLLGGLVDPGGAPPGAHLGPRAGPPPGLDRWYLLQPVPGAPAAAAGAARARLEAPPGALAALSPGPAGLGGGRVGLF